MSKNIFTLLLITVLSASVQAQQSKTSEQDDVVRISSNLVQVDAVVTDKDGNQINNLKMDDFEVYQDGKLQKVTNFSYISGASVNQKIGAEPNKSKTEKNAAPPPSPAVNTNNVGRLLTFIVDDGNCTASRVGMFAAREALEKFVTQQMQPNDAVAIYQTRSGSSLIQQYTADKAQLMRTVRKIRWFPSVGACGGNRNGDVFEPARADYTLKVTGQGAQSFESDASRKSREAGEDFDRDSQTVGMIGVLRYVVRGLEKLSGRKTVFLLSDGISLRGRDNSVRRAQDALRDVTDLANRAAVVFQTIDVRGVTNPAEVNAGDEVLVSGEIDLAKPSGTGKLVADRTAELRNTQEGLSFLAGETGGRFYHDNNFLDVPIRRALALEKGYYLLAYQPDDQTFKGKKFHQIDIKLKRPELGVRSRSGFYGVKDEETRAKPKTGDSELYEALVSPLPNANLNLKLSAFFGNTPTTGNFVRSLLYLTPNEISATDEANGKKLVFDVVAVTLNEKNEVVDEFNRTHTIHVENSSWTMIQQNGLVYTADVPIKKAGTYNFRMALRDASAKRLGSAGQTIEVPDLKKGKLLLSGLSASGIDANGKFVSPAAVKLENAFAPPASASAPAVRRFRAGDVLAYSYSIYNAQIDAAAKQPKLTIETNIYRDGQLDTKNQPLPADIGEQSDLSRISDYGYFRLNPAVKPGDYALQVIVKDLLTNQTSSQWIDFEVVK